MSFKTGNNIYAQLSAGINASDLSITLATGQGARFNFLSAATDYTYATLVRVATNALEIVKLLGPPAGDVLTVAASGRGIDGTTAISFTAGDLIEVRIPRFLLNKFVLDENLQQTTDLRATSVGGTSSAITSVHANPLSQFGLVDGLLSIFIPTANNPGAVTYQPDGLTAKPLVKGSNLGLSANDLVTGVPAWVIYSTIIGGGSWVLLNPAKGLAYWHGQCQLKLSIGNLVLSPCDGAGLICNSNPCIVPDATVSLAPTALSIGNYYIYASDVNSDGIVDTLTASSTGYVVQSATGVKVMSGDVTKTLVGIAYVADGPTWLAMRSYFNGTAARATATTVGNHTYNGASPAELENTARANILLWDGEIVDCDINSTVSVNVAGAAYGQTTVALDGAWLDTGSALWTTSWNQSQSQVRARATAINSGDGLHAISMLSSATGGNTGTWYAGSVITATSRGLR